MATDRPRMPRVPMRAIVDSREQLSDSLVRVVFTGADLERFEPSEFSDSYVKAMFLSPGVDYPRPINVDRIKAEFPVEHWPRLRSYTVRAWDQATHRLTIDFVVHGSAGVAGPWAAAAQPGDELHLLGPGGGYSPDPGADWHLLVGDESALPAIATALELLPAGADARVLVEVHGPGDEIALPIEVTWLHRHDEPVGTRLVAAVASLDFPAGTVHAFVHGEAGFVKELRRLLRVERNVAKEQLSISGYWRYGSDDEGWRAAKADWNREVEAVEAAAVTA